MKGRQRPNPCFRSDEPVRVARVEMNNEVGQLGSYLGIEKALPADAVSELGRIAARVKTSREIQRSSCSRPDANATLRRVAVMAGNLERILEDLPRSSRRKLAHHIHPLGKTPRGGLEHLSFLIAAVREIGTAARCANEYRRRLAQRHSTSFQRDTALEQLAACADQFWKPMFCLNSRTEWSLVLVQQEFPPPTWNRRRSPTRVVVEQLRWLKHASEIAYKFETRRRGPASDSVTYFAVTQLLALYRNLTRQQPTHSAGRGREYLGAALSPAGCFVEAAMLVIDPASCRRSVRDALEHVLWPSRMRLAGERAKRKRSSDEACMKAILPR